MPVRAGIVLLIGMLSKEIVFLPLLVLLVSERSNKSSWVVLLAPIAIVASLRLFVGVDIVIDIEGKWHLIPKTIGVGVTSLFCPFLCFRFGIF